MNDCFEVLSPWWNIGNICSQAFTDLFGKILHMLRGWILRTFDYFCDDPTTADARQEYGITAKFERVWDLLRTWMEFTSTFEETRMKTLVVYFNLDGFAVQLKNHLEDALDELQIEWKECHISDLQQASQDFQPTMHIFYHPNKLIYEYLEVIQELKGHKLLWTHEDPYESDLTFDMLPYFYYIFTSDENTATQLQLSAPNNSIKYVPHAFNPKVHKPMDVTYEYRSDVLFVGNAYESRLKYFAAHAEDWKDQMVTIVGVGYRGMDGYQNQKSNSWTYI
jgi:hypothetical protein